MLARPNFLARFATVLALAITIAAPASAQSANTDGRWLAWTGCWTPASTLIRVVGKSATSVVCVLPTSSASAVEVLTVTGGKVVDSTRVDTDGRQHPLAKEGCSGWQSAKWSPSSRRVYLKSEFSCNGAQSTHLSAVYAMAGSGEWINVQGMRVEKNSGVHAIRYRQATDLADVPAAVAQRVQQRPFAKEAAMLAVAEQPSLSDVEEASRELDANVVSTWLIESDKLVAQRPSQLNAKQLVQLADNGVPGSVIDVMLGLSYPEVLAVNPVNNGVARQNTDSAYAAYGSLGMLSSVNPIIGFDRLGVPIYASDAAMYLDCSRFMYSPFDMGLNLYSSQYACGSYGYGIGGFGFGYGYGRYPNYGYGPYYGSGPVVVPVGTGGSATPHGRIVNGKGYTSGDGGSSATPRSDRGASNGSAAGGGTASTSTTPSSPPPPRTAEPKKP